MILPASPRIALSVMQRYAVVLAMTLTVVACGDPAGDGTTAPEPTTSTSGQTPTTGPIPATSEPPTTTTPRSTSTTSPSIDVEFSGATVAGPDLFEVGLGETVDVWVLSDVDDEMHVHGYDLFFDLQAGVPFQLTFPADIPGIFEVEVHAGHTRLFEIRVSG